MSVEQSFQSSRLAQTEHTIRPVVAGFLLVGTGISRNRFLGTTVENAAQSFFEASVVSCNSEVRMMLTDPGPSLLANSGKVVVGV